MAVDIIHDLELDQEPITGEIPGVYSDQRLEEVRTYLATYYLVSKYVIIVLSLS